MEPPIKDLHNELVALRASLYDGNTRLPAYTACFEPLKRMAENQFLGAIFIQFSDLERVEGMFGFERYEAILRQAAFQITDVNHREFDGALLITQRGVYDDQFCIFVPCRLLRDGNARALKEVANRLYLVLEQDLSAQDLPGLSLHMGYSVLHNNPFLRFERLVHRAVEEAASVAHHQKEAEAVFHELELRQILARRSLSTVFHPIVLLEGYEIVGYEALTRGPSGTPYESPEILFSSARQSNLSRQLDHQCKLTAIASAKPKPKGSKLFINTLPTTLDDPDLLGDGAVRMLEASGLSPEDVVWELTERLPIDDYAAFAATMKGYLEMGYGVAIDDVGTGYSSIQTITHVRPSYLKIDLSLVKDIQANLLKQELVASLSLLAKNIGALVIAEGVGTIGEMEALKELGVPMAQGHLFGMPSRKFAETARPGS